MQVGQTVCKTKMWVANSPLKHQPHALPASASRCCYICFDQWQAVAVGGGSSQCQPAGQCWGTPKDQEYPHSLFRKGWRPDVLEYLILGLGTLLMYPKEQFTLYKVFMAATSIFVSDMGGGGGLWLPDGFRAYSIWVTYTLSSAGRRIQTA